MLCVRILNTYLSSSERLGRPFKSFKKGRSFEEAAHSRGESQLQSVISREVLIWFMR